MFRLATCPVRSRAPGSAALAIELAICRTSRGTQQMRAELVATASEVEASRVSPSRRIDRLTPVREGARRSSGDDDAVAESSSASPHAVLTTANAACTSDLRPSPPINPRLRTDRARSAAGPSWLQTQANRTNVNHDAAAQTANK
jgi:hypothetical protein